MVRAPGLENVLTEAIIEELERTNYEGATVLLFDEDCDWSVIFE